MILSFGAKVGKIFEIGNIFRNYFGYLLHFAYFCSGFIESDYANKHSFGPIDS
jgi:hypothetical protein